MKMKTTGSTCIQQPSSTLQSINKYQKGKIISPYYNYDTEQGRRRLQPPPPPPSSSSSSSSPFQQQHQQSKNSQNNNKKSDKSDTIHPFFLQKYKLECNILGKGGYGVVLLATDQVTNQRRAVKFIYKNKIPTSGWVVCDKTTLFRSSSFPITATTAKTKTNKLSSSSSSLSSSSFVTQKTCIPTEIYLLQKLNHPNIIKMFNVYQDDTFYYLVMETHGEDWSTPITSHDHHPTMKNNISKLEDSILLNNNNNINNTSGVKHVDHAQDLFECIEQHHHLSESIAQYIFKQLIRTVLYLKQNGIYHRDIKDENILIDRRYNIKLIDFGSAITIDTSKRQWISSFYGTLAYGSPEILCGRIYEPEPAEVWSLGVLLYTMLFGQVPFSTPLQVINGHYHSSSIRISKQCSQLLNMLLRKSPLHRPSIEEIASHEWLLMDL
ncbi:kinase-like domain-containing protein [Cunninghamella echinulata]|nr:kinase-like domain-containing protein [Cunninghamella echinulata]